MISSKLRNFMFFLNFSLNFRVLKLRLLALSEGPRTREPSRKNCLISRKKNQYHEKNSNITKKITNKNYEQMFNITKQIHDFFFENISRNKFFNLFFLSRITELSTTSPKGPDKQGRRT